ncbi:MAG: Crp/Fnr family transcriptional regulator [Elusimicrobiota bacterium]
MTVLRYRIKIAGVVMPIPYLRKIPLFSNLGRKDFELVKSIAKSQNYRKGERILSEGDKGDALFIVLKGLVKINKKAYGKIKTLAILKKGDFFGEMSLIDKEARSASAYAMQDVELLLITRSSFTKTLKNNSALTGRIIETLCERLRRANEEIEILSFQNIVGRMATTILYLAEKYGRKQGSSIKINLKLTKKDLAEMVGTAREVVSRVARNLIHIGCIDMKSNYIIIKDKEKLESFIQ